MNTEDRDLTAEMKTEIKTGNLKYSTAEEDEQMRRLRSGNPAPRLLMLDEPRELSLLDRRCRYTFRFRRITDADWRRYFAGILHTAKNEGKATVTTLDVESGGLELVEETLTWTEGYAGEFMAKPGWQKLIPPRHSNTLSWLLRMVAVSEPPAEAELKPFNPELIEVSLDALWSKQGDEMTLFKGLTHSFGPPSPRQKQRFYRATASSRVTGGRNGVTVYAGRHAVLLEIYDELVVSVDGYGIAGRALQPGEIAREMDAYHKIMAVQQVFSGGGEE